MNNVGRHLVFNGHAYVKSDIQRKWELEQNFLNEQQRSIKMARQQFARQVDSGYTIHKTEGLCKTEPQTLIERLRKEIKDFCGGVLNRKDL